MHDRSNQVTTFRLNGHNCQEFVARTPISTTAEPAGFHPGTERDDGTIIDMLIWDSAKQLQRASGIMTEMGHSPVHGMIDHSTVDWTVAPVRHRIG